MTRRRLALVLAATVLILGGVGWTNTPQAQAHLKCAPQVAR